ncbi:hypothetical protein Nmel_006845 [Mimus melanotis]
MLVAKLASPIVSSSACLFLNTALVIVDYCINSEILKVDFKSAL